MIGTRRQRIVGVHSFPPFHVGQRVKMSAFGYTQLRLDSIEAFEASKDLVITNIQGMALGVWAIDVNNPLINMFLLEAEMFEPFEK